jgi:hypothetical protein
MLKFIGGHGQMSDKLYNKIMDTCPYDQLVGYNGVQVTDPECKSLIAQAEKQMGGYYIYNLYDDCWYQNDLNPPSKSFDQRGRTWWGPPPAPMPHQIQSMLEGAENDYACGGPAAMFTWILNAEVKKALNVEADAKLFMGDNGVGFTYNMTEKNLLPFYQEVVDNTTLRVLVYNGDTDPCLDSLTA